MRSDTGSLWNYPSSVAAQSLLSPGLLDASLHSDKATVDLSGRSTKVSLQGCTLGYCQTRITHSGRLNLRAKMGKLT